MHVYPTVFEVITPHLRPEVVVDPTTPLQRGQRLLVMGEGVDICGLKRLEADPFVLPRALAYYDLVCGARELRREVPAPLAWASSRDIETASSQVEWMLERLAESCPRFEDMAQHLCRTECYQLVRFVLARSSECSIAAMARQYGLSDVHFYRLCKKYFGQSLKRRLRVHRAACALLEGIGPDRNFTQLALEHGYSSASHFCAEIKAITGTSPSSLYEITRTH
ncbi:helix-turn-helix domain-containing protein [Pseudoxanthomonas sp. UTMC 1351]|uniref:helix-turn-helix domain-containing protein n=1 Tax=Pseudoxanthomonas sp. UTMC 1351 TaxID=2695853 RepID=UPI0034CD414D